MKSINLTPIQCERFERWMNDRPVLFDRLRRASRRAMSELYRDPLSTVIRAGRDELRMLAAA